jgi:hypothetical protein
LWQEVVDLVDDVYFFGPQLPSTRYYSYFFSISKSTYVAYMNTIFCELAQEIICDALVSRALYHAYLKHLMVVYEKESSRDATKEILLRFDKVVSKIDLKQYFLAMDHSRESKWAKIEAKNNPLWEPIGTNVNKTDLFCSSFDRHCRSLFQTRP